jgi:hypothetical protein
MYDCPLLSPFRRLIINYHSLPTLQFKILAYTPYMVRVITLMSLYCSSGASSVILCAASSLGIFSRLYSLFSKGALDSRERLANLCVQINHSVLMRYFHRLNHLNTPSQPNFHSNLLSCLSTGSRLTR